MNPSVGRYPGIGIEVRLDREHMLPGRAWCADRPRALVAIVHGLGEHSGRYAALAGELVSSRYTVVALDLPGHGEASGPRGHIESWTQLRDQIVPSMFTASRGLPNQPMDLPAVLLGHSMGAVVALDYALEHPKDLVGVVASAPGLRSAPPPMWKMALGNVARMAAPTAAFAHGLDESGMSRDQEVLDWRKNDPRMHDKISPKLYFQFLAARERVMAGARNLQVPTLLLHGTADRVVDPKATLEFNAAAPHGISRLITYPDVYHELFNDLGREQAIKDLLGWLELVVVM